MSEFGIKDIATVGLIGFIAYMILKAVENLGEFGQGFISGATQPVAVAGGVTTAISDIVTGNWAENPLTGEKTIPQTFAEDIFRAINPDEYAAFIKEKESYEARIAAQNEVIAQEAATAAAAGQPYIYQSIDERYAAMTPEQIIDAGIENVVPAAYTKVYGIFDPNSLFGQIFTALGDIGKGLYTATHTQ
jgi:hypothetical protein